MLPTAWGQPAQGPSAPHHGYHSPGSLTCWLYQYETTLEPNQSPRVANVLVYKDHFMKHVLAYVTPNQIAKTIIKFLYHGYIFVLGAPARLLSDRCANFMSSVIEEMYKILGIKKLQTMPYQPQTNGLVERSNQTIMWMIRKLGGDKSQLAIPFGWNSTHLQHHMFCSYRIQSHYLMFRWRPRLQVDFYFPTIGSNEAPIIEVSAKHVDQICSFCSRQIEDCPVGGASPINHRGMPTKMVLGQKDRCCEPEAWWPGTSKGRCF